VLHVEVAIPADKGHDAGKAGYHVYGAVSLFFSFA